MSNYYIKFSQRESVLTTYGATVTDEAAQAMFDQPVSALTDAQKASLAHHASSLRVLDEEGQGDAPTDLEIISVEAV